VQFISLTETIMRASSFFLLSFSLLIMVAF
jgi:hypothetical protein